MTVREYNTAVKEFGDPVFRFIFRSIRDRDRSNDIVQDTYEKLWMLVTEIDFVSVKSWLFATAYNRMIDVIRKDSRLVMIEYYDEASLMMDESSSDLNEVLHKALERLPAQQRAVILLRDYEGYSYQEISSITGLSEAQVKVYIYRGRVSLRNYLVRTGQAVMK
jgi:RNA polymerase sigma factor (sigma-70 family)